MSKAATKRSAGHISGSAAPAAANDSGRYEHPAVGHPFGAIPEDRRRRFAEVLARILVTRALLALGIHPSINE